jgi:hypothetical protein
MARKTRLPRRRTALVGVAIFVVLAGAGAAWSSASASPAGGIVSVAGGFHRDVNACFYLLDGTLTFCAQRAVDENVDAHGSGSGVATGVLLSGTNGDTFGFAARVTCMTVVGNEAVVGGIITRDADPSFVGDGVKFFVIDNGDPGNGNVTPDKVSGNEVMTPDEFAGGFPLNCGAPVSTFTGYTDLLDGDVSIHGGL